MNVAKYLSPRPWSLEVEDGVATIVDALGNEVCRFWYDEGYGLKPVSDYSEINAIAITELINGLPDRG